MRPAPGSHQQHHDDGGQRHMTDDGLTGRRGDAATAPTAPSAVEGQDERLAYRGLFQRMFIRPRSAP